MLLFPEQFATGGLRQASEEILHVHLSYSVAPSETAQKQTNPNFKKENSTSKITCKSNPDNYSGLKPPTHNIIEGKDHGDHHGKKVFKLPYPHKKVSLYQLTSLLHTREIKRLTLRKSISLSQKSKVNWDNFPLTCQRISAQLEHLCSTVSHGSGVAVGELETECQD